MCKILIADDSDLFRHSLRSCLEQNPHLTVCAEATNGAAAVEKFKELHPDVVILDWQMPVMDGLEAARHIARITPSVTMALFTMHSGNQLTKQAEAAGIQRVFAKGDRFDTLSDWLSTVCNGRAS